MSNSTIRSGRIISIFPRVLPAAINHSSVDLRPVLRNENATEYNNQQQAISNLKLDEPPSYDEAVKGINQCQKNENVSGRMNVLAIHDNNVPFFPDQSQFNVNESSIYADNYYNRHNNEAIYHSESEIKCSLSSQVLPCAFIVIILVGAFLLFSKHKF